LARLHMPMDNMGGHLSPTLAILATLADLAAAHPRLLLEHGAGSQAAFLALPSGATQARAAESTFEATLSVAPAGTLDEVTLEIQYLKPVAVRREVLELELPARTARALRRDGTLAELPSVSLLDAWSPKYLEASSPAGTVALLGGDDIEAMAVQRGAES